MGSITLRHARTRASMMRVIKVTMHANGDNATRHASYSPGRGDLCGHVQVELFRSGMLAREIVEIGEKHVSNTTRN